MAVKQSPVEAIISDLTAPFEDEQKTDANTVAPHHYLRRLLDVVPGLYSISRSAPIPVIIGDAAAIAVVTNVTIEYEEGDQKVYGDIGAKGVTDSQEDKDLANVIKSASSDSLKRALLGAGVNLDTYEEGNYQEETPAEKPARTRRGAAKPKDEEPEEEEKPARRGRTAPAARSSRGGKSDYDGSEDIPFGAHKGTAWKDIHGSYLAFCEGKFDKGKNLDAIVREIERREADGSYDPEESDGKGPSKTARRSSGRTAGKY